MPTLSASVDQTNLQVNGNQVINSATQTTELPLNFTVNTNNRTGYTATISAETDNTFLSNNTSSTGAKISSISSNAELSDLPNNTWGYRFGTSTNYAPIPALSAPSQIIQTTGKTNGNESNQLSIGMKLADNLESGNYTNKLILSFISNPYQLRAMMTNGPDFNTRVGNLDPNPAYFSGPDSMLTKPNIKAFKRSVVAPANSVSTINIEDPDMSDYEIKAWYNTADQAVYYYAEPNAVFLNENSEAMFRWFTKIETVDLASFNTSEVTSMNAMFYMMNSLKNIDVSGFNTSKVTDMNSMFDLTGVIEQLDVSSFDTSNVTDMKWMFFGLSKVNKLDLTNFNTSRVTNMSDMFDSMTNVKEIKFGPNFNTSNVTDMTLMFAKTTNLKNLNLASFNTEKVRNMSGMFYGSDSLTSLDLSSFNTKNVTNMSYMFFGLDEITTINIINFDTRNVENMSYLFGTETGSVDHLTTIYVNNNFNTDKLLQSENIFMNRYQLRGGAGSFLANPSSADKTWLRIDDPINGHPGYFTRKL